MFIARRRHTATLLGSGEVLVAGSGNPAELYDPATNTWPWTGAMSEDHGDQTATLLGTGKVVVAGGASAELYDSATKTWSLAGAMKQVRDYTPLSEKRAYVDKLGDARLKEVRDSGHAAPLDQPLQIIEAATAFFSEIESASGARARKSPRGLC